MADSGNQNAVATADDLISAFARMTGVRESEARGILEAFSYNFESAIAHYFEENVYGPVSAPGDASASVPEEIAVNVQPKLMKAKSIPPPSSIATRSEPPRGYNSVVTLASLNRDNDGENSEPEKEEGQAFYAGGSVNSGQQVIGPSKKKSDNTRMVKDLFDSMRRHGAEVVDPPPFGSREKPEVVAFKGVGHVLGSTPDTSEIVSSQEEETPPSRSIKLTAYRDGFSLDGGPLRDYHDPKNKAFMEAIAVGQVPKEIIEQSAPGEVVTFNIENNSAEDWKPGRQSLQAFSGSGHRLGSPTPPIASVKPQTGSKDNQDQADQFLNVNESQPTTMIQVRLSDGTKLVLKVNHTHTVSDIRRYIVLARPEYGAVLFSLMTSYPPLELTDDSITVKDANLLNSVIVQKLN